MCRFILFKGEESVLLADLLTRPAHSIINQSFDSRLRVDLHRPLNGDGFGVGWYDFSVHSTSSFRTLNGKGVDKGIENDVKQVTSSETGTTTPCIFTSVLPAWNNPNLNRLAEKIHSRLVFCHVRAASPGFPISETNCHPFYFGSLMFMHNGYIADFKKIKRRLERLFPDPVYHAMNGNTDSEYCFSLFLSLLSNPQKKSYSLQELLDALGKTIDILNEFSRDAGIRAHSLMNFALSDGNYVICSRYVNVPGEEPASLFYSSGTRFESLSQGNYRMVKDDKRPRMTIIASEPLTFERSDWVAIPKNTMMVLTRHQGVLFYRIPENRFY